MTYQDYARLLACRQMMEFQLEQNGAFNRRMNAYVTEGNRIAENCDHKYPNGRSAVIGVRTCAICHNQVSTEGENRE